MSGIDVTNSIVVFDEAHNIEQMCEDMTCFEITINELFNCYQTLKDLEKAYEDKDMKDFSIGSSGVKYKR